MVYEFTRIGDSGDSEVVDQIVAEEFNANEQVTDVFRV
jgi:hypothetical protein